MLPKKYIKFSWDYPSKLGRMEPPIFGRHWPARCNAPPNAWMVAGGLKGWELHAGKSPSSCWYSLGLTTAATTSGVPRAAVAEGEEPIRRAHEEGEPIRRLWRRRAHSDSRWRRRAHPENRIVKNNQDMGVLPRTPPRWRPMHLAQPPPSPLSAAPLVVELLGNSPCRRGEGYRAGRVPQNGSTTSAHLGSCGSDSRARGRKDTEKWDITLWSF
jgi:hypothetical protein